MRIGAAILAAGKGERFGGDKVLEGLGGKPVWRWSFDTFKAHPAIEVVGIVGSEANLSQFAAAEADWTIQGGADRQESSRRAVDALDCDIVLLHDAARPFVSIDVIDRVIEAVSRTGAAAPGVAVADTLRLRNEQGYSLVDRSRTVGMQTPQGAMREVLLEAHRRADELYTDEMALIEAIGALYEIVEGDVSNFKITTSDDLKRARAIVENVEIRTGFGYDIHPFATDDRPLMLGGVHFPGSRGLHGHSDADVVIHAVVDALLGAASLGDIGQHFPNTDPRWKGEPSLTFLRHAIGLLRENGWQVVNVDVSVIAEQPKVMTRAAEVRQALAEALDVDPSRVSFKATTNERLGSLGRGEGIAAHAVATIRGCVIAGR